MRHLIIATDFSPASDNAMLYGGALATRLNYPVLLLNAYDFPPLPFTGIPEMIMPYESFPTLSIEGLKLREEKLRASFPGLTIETKSTIGDVVVQLNEVAGDMEPLLVVIGSKEKPLILFGSTSTAIVKNCIHPVLSIPESYAYSTPKVAILATDLSPISGPVLQRLQEIVNSFQLEMHVVHVTNSEEVRSHEEVMQNISELGGDFKTIINNDLSEGIEDYTRQLNADLVITFPHSHTWLQDLFRKKHTKELVTELSLPLLCIPETT